MQELLIGVTPIVRGTLEDKIRLALRLYDEDDTQWLTREGMEYVLRTMNKTLGILGDPVRQSA